MQSVGREMGERIESIKKATASALTFLDISEEDFMNSFKNVMQHPEYKKQAERLEKDVREKVEPHKPLDKSRDEYKRMYCEELQMEAKADMQMQQQIP